MKKTFVLAGDIGGTKTIIGLFSSGKTRPRIEAYETYSSRDAAGLEALLKSFLEKYPVEVEKACLGMAGPVLNGRCKVTNLPWYVDERKLQAQFKWPSVKIVNDLAAAAMMVPLLTAREYTAINRARSNKCGNIAVVAPGTGLGVSLLVYADGRYCPVSSEGGHINFTPENELERNLLKYLKKKNGYVSYEKVASGQGIVNIFSFLKETGKYRVPLWLEKDMKSKGIAKAVTEGAVKRRNPACIRTVEIFLSGLGSFVGNLALTGMATGGIYLGGGIFPDILQLLRTSDFMKCFTNKGRFKEMLENIPVRVILNKKAALLGAAVLALKK